jgi:uncharacterized protein GlcG (DUF336 family)
MYKVLIAHSFADHAQRDSEQDAFNVAATYVKEHPQAVAVVRTADTEEALVVIANKFAYVAAEPATS